MSRNLFLIPLWKRPEITRLCLLNLQHQEQDILCIVSRTEDAELCNLLGVPMCWHPNEQLGRKWNFGLKKAEVMDWDYIVTLGSDDIVKTTLFDFYNAHPKHDVLITDKIYFVDAMTGRASIITRARIGAGRRISRKVIEACRYRLWTDERNKSLDMDSNGAMSNAGFATAETRTEAHICGIKSPVNIWSYDHTLRHGCEVPMADALSDIPIYIRDEMRALLRVPVK